MKQYKVIDSLVVTTQDGKEIILQSGTVFSSNESIEIEGVEEVLFEPVLKTFTPWWFDDYGIQDIWEMGYTGEGVKVAVLDTGIYLENGGPHLDIEVNVENLFDASKSPSGMRDYGGHGVHISGIIKATNNGYGVTGIAHNCDFYFAKITSDRDGGKIEYLIEALNWAIEQKVDVINISHGHSNATNDFKANGSELEKSINKVLEQNIIIVAAAGNGSRMLYPAGFEGVISVGSVDVERQPSRLISKTMIYAPGEEIYSTFKNPPFEISSGSSQACAYMTGVIALMIEKYKNENKSYTIGELKNKLLDNAAVSDSISLVQPIKTIQSI